jgi:hypothetical protein
MKYKVGDKGYYLTPFGKFECVIIEVISNLKAYKVETDSIHVTYLPEHDFKIKSIAQEMFEKLGYTIDVRTSDYLEIGNANYSTINFWIKEKVYDCDESHITVELHQAIHQQMRELEWLQ